MNSTIDDLSWTDSADAAYMGGDLQGALAMYIHLLNKNPSNLFVWFATASIMGRLGDAGAARGALLQVSGALAESGYLLLALVAARQLAEHDDGAFKVLLGDISAMYGAGSPRLARRRHSVPPPLPERLHMEEMDDLDDAGQTDEARLLMLAREACQEASELWDARPEPGKGKVPFHPLFSDLRPLDLAALVPLLELRMLPGGYRVIQQGDEGTSVFMLIRGAVKVSRKSGEERLHLATLGAGAFFGEMALLTASPRAASVTCLHPTMVFELGRRGLEGLAGRNPAIAEVLASYTRERLLRNLMATSPLFRPLEPDRREGLTRLFHSRVYRPGEVILGEGEQSDNLYTVLSGTVSISKGDEGGDVVQLAELHPGDIFGEISMIQRRPTTATVSAATKSVMLYLTREDFDANIGKFPEVLSAVYKIAVNRERENIQTESGPVLPVDDSEVLI